MPPRAQTKDGVFYGWIIVAALLMMTVIIMGMRFSFGVFFKAIEGEFGLSRTATSAIFSTQMALGCVFPLIFGWVTDRYGPKLTMALMGFFTGLGLLLTSQSSMFWQLFVTYSLLMSVGTAMFTVVSATVTRWFFKRRTLALGLTLSGAGFGQMLMVPFAALLIAGLTWRPSFLVLGLLTWGIILPLTLLLKKEPRDIGAVPYGAELPRAGEHSGMAPPPTAAGSPLGLFRTRNFWLFVFTTFLYASSIFLIITHLVPHATDLGISTAAAATVMSVIGFAAIFGRIFIGVVADRLGKQRSVAVSLILQTLVLLWLVNVHDLWQFYLFAVIFGLAQGGFSPVVSSLFGDAFGLERIGVMIGLVDIGFSLGAASGPVIGGMIFDATGSYSGAFMFGAGAALLGAVFISAVKSKARPPL
ncbi:MAG: MFS transporter [Chloroflexota bacterium]